MTGLQTLLAAAKKARPYVPATLASPGYEEVSEIKGTKARDFNVTTVEYVVL